MTAIEEATLRRLLSRNYTDVLFEEDPTYPFPITTDFHVLKSVYDNRVVGYRKYEDVEEGKEEETRAERYQRRWNVPSEDSVLFGGG